MHSTVTPLARILDLNTDLLLNCLEGLTEEEARRRLSGGGNSMAFLAAHLTDVRHFLVNRLGHPLRNPLSRYLAQAKSIEDMVEWPTLEEIREAWLVVSDHVAAVLERLTQADLERDNVHTFPLGDATALGLIAFLAQHDSYHVGQAGFLRRQLGKPAMSYARGSRLRPPAPAA